MILGLTGFSGSGKSTVAEIFKEQGFYHLDCDFLVHEVVYKDPVVLRAIADQFGEDLIQDSALNRPLLRQKTVGNPETLSLLNRTVMPFILAAIETVLKENSASPIILDAPLLFESKLDQRCDRILSVIADKDAAKERIIERDHLRPEDAQKRLSSQHPAEYYIEKSHYIIYNNSDLAALRAQTLELIHQIHEETL